MKKCITCGATKILKEYTIRSDTGKHKNECKQCVNDKATIRRYGISLNDYDLMLEEQGGVCAICGTDDPRASRFHIDHNHGTGKVRGLLCATCNQGIGLLQDSPFVLSQALNYLLKEGHYGEN